MFACKAFAPSEPVKIFLQLLQHFSCQSALRDRDEFLKCKGRNIRKHRFGGDARKLLLQEAAAVWISGNRSCPWTWCSWAVAEPLA